MSISESPSTESNPSLDQLDKIVDSLGLLIQMQTERDERVEFTLNRLIRNQETLESKIEKLAAGNREPFENGGTAAIFAKYGIGSDNEPETAQSVDSESADIANSESEPAIAQSSEEVACEDSEREMPPMDREEIEEIKEQLRQTLREAEVEFAVRRARLSHREAIIEEKEERLKREQRKNSIFQDNTEGNTSDTMLNRLKLHLREFTADKMAKQKGDPSAGSDDDPSEEDGQ